MPDTAKTPIHKRVHHDIKENNERGARTSLIEELFYDFGRSKKQVYTMNFFRGVFFGIGSVVGGALIISVVALVLGLFVDLPGGVGDFVQSVLDAMSTRS